MAVESYEKSSTAIDRVGRTGIYPASGPLPPGEAVVRGQEELAHPESRRIGRAAARDWQSGTLLAVGRTLFGGYFVYNGINHFANLGMMAEYARSKQVPLPGAAVAVTGVMLLAGGLSLLTGARPRVGSALVSAFLLGVTPKMHNYWDIEDAQQQMQERVNFTKNVALLGGAFLAAALPGPWPASMDQVIGTGRQRALARR